MTGHLPEEFADLAPLLEWSLPTEYECRAKRAASTMPQLRLFYSAMLERMEDVLSYLAKLPAEVNTQVLLATALAEIAPAIEPSVSAGIFAQERDNIFRKV